MRKKMTIILLFISNTLYAGRMVRDDWRYYNDQEVELYQQQTEMARRAGHLVALKLAKKAIIEGKTEAAKFFLDRIPNHIDKVALVKKRYLSLIYFIEEDYKKSVSATSHPIFNDAKFYQQVCMIKMLARFALNDKESFNDEFRTCLGTTFTKSPTDQYWTRVMADVKNNDQALLRGTGFESMRAILGDIEITKIWLKLSLYLNRENVALKYLEALPEEAYRSQKIRELIGFIYFRTGNKKKAFEFIEDIDSSNAENIKGNLRLDSKEYELAYGHFKLALKYKSNSLNAMERILPLIWLLEQWSEGEEILSRVQSDRFDEKGKLALDTAIKIRQEKFDLAEKNLNRIDTIFKGKVPLVIEKMALYNNLRQGKPVLVEEFSSRTCRKMDGMGCWLMQANLTWENLGKTLNRDDNVLAKDYNIDEYKVKLEVSPLSEKRFIDQKDIEELDNARVQMN